MAGCAPNVFTVLSVADSLVEQPSLSVNATLPVIPISIENGTSTTLYNYFSLNPAIIFVVPGAFSPTCSSRHFPGYLQHAAAFKTLGLQIFCLSVNDAFVLHAWRESLGCPPEVIGMIADVNGTAVKALGLGQLLSHRSSSDRVKARRCAIVIARGVVRLLQFDEEAFAEKVLERLGSFYCEPLRLGLCLEQAQKVISYAHSPYSKRSACGVAIQTNKGILNGCTVENCAYPHSVCGIKAALAGAISVGVTRIDGMVFVGENTKDCIPGICGQCREFASQFGAFPVVAAKNATEFKILNTATFLPEQSVEPDNLKSRCYELDESSITQYSLDIAIASNCSTELKELYKAAILACHTAYTPVSQFPVGAAVLTDAGIFSGCNVEHRVISLGICAERNTLCKAVAGGAKEIKVLALVCFKMEAYGSPCGGCRQSLVEFENFPVHLLRMHHSTRTYDVSVTTSFKLLPDAFTPAALK